jgi:large subunit ribosomal protein L29
MKSKDLLERSEADLAELGRQLQRDLFSARMKNHTGQLDDTSQLRKLRRDLARIAQVQGLRAKAAKASAEPAGSEK